MTQDVLKRYTDVVDRIKKISADKNRSPPTLIVVTKTIPATKIEHLLAAGHRDFGENRVQDAYEKWPALKKKYKDVCLHMIGSLQTNKAKEATCLFDAIHTVDRIRLAEKLAEENYKGDCFIQINTGDEKQKGGLHPAALAGFLTEAPVKKLSIAGLMAIPPHHENPSPHFAFLQALAKKQALPLLSMGMSDDYDTAIAFGATHVRIGTAIFGGRKN